MLTRDRFVDELITACLFARGTVVEHLEDNQGELLLHLLMSDLLRLTVDLFAGGRIEQTDQLLQFVDRCLREGDEHVVNAVAVSFIENFGAWPGESDDLLSRWPLALRQELGR